MDSAAGAWPDTVSAHVTLCPLHASPSYNPPLPPQRTHPGMPAPTPAALPLLQSERRGLIDEMHASTSAVPDSAPPGTLSVAVLSTQQTPHSILFPLKTCLQFTISHSHSHSFWHERNTKCSSVHAFLLMPVDAADLGCVGSLQCHIEGVELVLQPCLQFGRICGRSVLLQRRAMQASIVIAVSWLYSPWLHVVKSMIPRM